MRFKEIFYHLDTGGSRIHIDFEGPEAFGDCTVMIAGTSSGIEKALSVYGECEIYYIQAIDDDFHVYLGAPCCECRDCFHVNKCPWRYREEDCHLDRVKMAKEVVNEKFKEVFAWLTEKNYDEYRKSKDDRIDRIVSLMSEIMHDSYTEIPEWASKGTYIVELEDDDGNIRIDEYSSEFGANAAIQNELECVKQEFDAEHKEYDWEDFGHKVEIWEVGGDRYVGWYRTWLL